MQARHTLPVFILVVFFPFLLKSQCTLSVNLGADVSICRNASKTFTATSVGGTPAYNYTWSNGSILPELTVSEAGNYAVTVTDANGCTATDAVGVSVLDISTFTLEIRSGDTAMFVSCTNKNVIVKAQPDGIVPVANFTWNTGETSKQFINAYTAGTYAVTVTAVNGCQSSKSIAVTQNTSPPNVSIVPFPNTATINCYTNRIILEGSSTTNGVTFVWSTGETNSAIGVTTGGIYTLKATDSEFGGNGCTASTQIEVKNTIPLVDLGADKTIPSGQTTTLTAVVTRGAGPYTYTWSNGLGTTPSVTVGASGIYLVTVTDPIGCTATDNIEVIVQANLTVNLGVDAATCKDVAKTFTASVSNGVAPFRYLWSNGATTSSISVRTAGNYSVTVTDATGTTGSDLVVLTTLEVPDISILSSPTNATLNCNNPQVSLNAISTTPNTTFAWNTGATTSSIVATTEGTYTVKAALNTCTASAQIKVKRDNNTPSVDLGADRTITSGQSATLTATITKGLAPFTYAWSNGLPATPSVSVSTAGTYKVTITDANGCTATDAVVVTSSGGCSLTLSIGQTNNYCFGSSSGSIYVGYIGGGVAPYQYSFDGGSTFSGSQNKSNLAAGTYIVVVKDANNCTGSKTIIITEGAKINFTATATTTCGNTGSITISNVTGGNGTSYQFTITNLPVGHRYTGAWVSNTVFNNLPANTYFVKVRDAGNCSTQPPISVVVGSVSGISATIAGNATVCFGSTTTLTATPTGGNAPFTYSWVKPNASTANTQAIQGGVGNYFVTITDANGCSAVATKAVTGVMSVTASITGNTSLCATASTTLTAVGISGTPPYNFVWSTGQTGTTSNSTTGVSVTVGTGNYCVTITDATGCTSSLCKMVTTSSLNFTFTTAKTPVLCNGGNDGTISVSAVTGGTAPYSYSKDNGASWQADNEFSHLPGGVYNVKIRDSKGCSGAARSTVVTQPAPITFATSVGDVTCGFTYNGVIGVTSVKGGYEPYKYSRGSNFQPSSNFTGLIAGTYPIQVKDRKGCLSTIKNTVVTNSCPIVTPLIQLVPTQFIPIVITRASPNPASDELNLDVSSLKVREQQFDFINVFGRIMISEKRHLEPGPNRVPFDVSTLLPGTYFIQTLGTGEGKNQPRLFVKM